MITIEKLYDKLGDMVGNGFGNQEFEVSVDVSTGDKDADHRIFAKAVEIKYNDSGNLTILCEKTSDNFRKE